MVVIYAEKASLCKAIAAALGAGKRIANPKDIYSGIWEFDWGGESAVLCHGAGHLAGLIAPEEYDPKFAKWDIETYPCIPENYKIKPTSPQLLEYVGEQFKRADWLINATDPDREGELIFSYVMEFLNIQKPWKRVILSDLTEKTIQNAFANLTEGAEMKPLALAGRARAVSDWLYGMNLTVAASKRYGSYGNIMNIGRVKTATLAIIVARENEIKNFKKTLFWRVFADFNGIIAEHITGKFEDKTVAENLLKEVINQQGTVTKKSAKERSESAPLLYNSTGLQAAAGEILGLGLDETVKIMQKLYENEFITYPRTSSEHLPNEMKNDVQKIIENLFSLPLYSDKKPVQYADFTARHFDNSKVGSHTAIIPTAKIPTEEQLNDNEKKVYDLVAKSVLRLAFKAAKFEDTELEIAVGIHIFKAKASLNLETGWRIFDSKMLNSKSFSVSVNDILNGNFSLKEGVTEPPKRYTEATLIKTMETCGQNFEDEEIREMMKRERRGLGSDATRANIIAELFKNNFICKKGKSLIPTDKGLFIIEKLPCVDLKSPETTGKMEMKLSEIAESGENCERLYNDFLTQINKNVKDFYEQIKNSKTDMFTSEEDKNFICPLCKRKLIQTKYTYSCSGWNDEIQPCDFAVSLEISGKKVTKSEVTVLVGGGRTALMHGFKSQDGKTVFDAFLVLVKDGIPVKDKNGNPTGKKKYVKFEFQNKK